MEESEGPRHPGSRPPDSSTWLPAPAWLLTPATPADIPPPVETRQQSLPVHALSWENFERLCLRLLQLESDPVHVSGVNGNSGLTSVVARRYGTQGQPQDGIDIYARDRLIRGKPAPERRYVTLQSRRVQEVRQGDLRAAIDHFLDGKWASVCRRFIFATSASTESVQLQDEIERVAAELIENSVELVVWDEAEISSRLRDQPEVIDDFFGRAWVRRLCGESVAGSLRKRLDIQEVNRLRQELRQLYTGVFGVADSGQIAFSASEARAVALRDRFVTPDLLSTSGQAASLSFPSDVTVRPDSPSGDSVQQLQAEAARQSTLHEDESAWFTRNQVPLHLEDSSLPVTDRSPADQLLGTETHHVIVGEPGAGKSTLLRYLVLDLLSEDPQWPKVTQRWGQRLPVWLPFHFFTQRSKGRTGTQASISAAINAWLQQNDAGNLWPLVESALDDKRLLLVVDGLDEWVSEDAGHFAIDALKAFSDVREIPLVASTRPYGLTRLRLGGGWVYSQIAPLTTEQQRLVAWHYFRAAFESEGGRNQPNAADRLVDEFMLQVNHTPDLRSITRTPLFLILLVSLHLSSVTKLPSVRFDAYRQALQLLIADHPVKRRVAAAVTMSAPRLSEKRLRSLFARVAYDAQSRGDLSTISEETLRDDFVRAVRDPDFLGMEFLEARETADQYLDMAEGELGLLVRKSPMELGFLHRMLQDQLAAEYIAHQLDAEARRALLEDRIEDTRWREVFLDMFSILENPAELRTLVSALEGRVDESPIGLRLREMLAELTFGPYEFPANVIHEIAPDIIEAIESHPYGPHRARLLDKFVVGLSGSTTAGIVRECLERWTIQIQEPTPELVRELGQIQPSEAHSETICKLLMRALCYPDEMISYTAALAIANRCANDGPGSDAECVELRKQLLLCVSNPPAALTEAAAVTALALGWRNDPWVVDILAAARSHSEDSVRMVALGDALGVLRSSFALEPQEPLVRARPLQDDEREWILGHLRDYSSSHINLGLLQSSVQEIARGRQDVLVELLDSLTGPVEKQRRYRHSHLLWPVALGAYSQDERVVELVCQQLRSEENSRLVLGIMFDGLTLLGHAYPPGSRFNESVGAAIEDRLRTLPTKDRDRELYRLAAVDQGPLMKDALLEELHSGYWPHWAAHGLIEYFGDDDGVRAAIRTVLFGEPVRASMIATVAVDVIPDDELLPRLLEMITDLNELDNPETARYDFISIAVVDSCRQQSIEPGVRQDEIAEQFLGAMPTSINSPAEDPRYEIAAALYPSKASQLALKELGKSDDRPLVSFLRAFRNAPEQLHAVLERVSTVLCSLPVHLRARICKSFVEHTAMPTDILSLTERWGEDTAGLNKSAASLAYHRALLRGWEEGSVSDEKLATARSNLAEMASAYGPDHDQKRRAAWVGMCVLGDWSMIRGRVETIGDSLPIGVSLTDVLHGPDLILIEQLALRWSDLRSEFGDTLLSRLSGLRERERERELWGALALFAHAGSALNEEVASAVADKPELLDLGSVLTWFATRASVSSEEKMGALVPRLGRGSYRGGGVASVLLTEPERIGLDRSETCLHLEAALRGWSPEIGDPALATLATLKPTHEAVTAAWQQLSGMEATQSNGEDRPVDGRTYFAVGFAASESTQVLSLMEHGIRFLEESPRQNLNESFTRHVSLRLRRDETARRVVREAVMNADTPPDRAALLASALAEAVGLDNQLSREIERRISAQADLVLSPMVADFAVSATLSPRTVFTRIVDAALDVQVP